MAKAGPTIQTQALKDKVVFITGGGRGIGRTIAVACAEQGAKVAAVARSPKDLEETLGLLKGKGGPHLVRRCDVTDAAQLEEAVTAVEKQLGAIYGLVCAAGIYGEIGAFSTLAFADWEKAIQVNLIGTARTVHTILPHMLKRKSGRIILFSGGGQGAMPNFSSYVTSKGGIWRFNETLAAELAPSGIYVNAVAPGAVNTVLLDELLAAGPEKVGRSFYEKSLTQKQTGGESPDRAADLCVYLLSEQSTGLYGKIISAIWDEYRTWNNLEELSKSDKFTPRRMV